MLTTEVPVQRQDVEEAVSHLARSRHGREAMQSLLSWLDANGCSLDQVNQECVFTVLEAAWGAYAGTTRDLMREALDQ